jgi:hypothetical protein
MVLEQLAEIYSGRDDYEACGQVLDMEAKVLEHCKRHSSVPGAAHELMPFCEKTEFRMLSNRYNLNEKLEQHEENIPIFRKLYEYEATLDMPQHQKVNTNMWKEAARLYNFKKRQSLNDSSLRGLSDKTILKVVLHSKEAIKRLKSTNPALLKEIEAKSRATTARNLGVSEEELALGRYKGSPSVHLLTCGHCGKEESSLGEFKTCNKCKQVAYCGPKCQQKHWKKHKKKCIPKDKK